MAKRILIADDSLTIQKAFAMTFAGEDVTLLAARSADEGLTLARQGRPDLVIADVAMPGRSGYELCSAIKSDAGLRGVPVYILSSSQNPYDESRGRQSGADGQFTKPFDSVALVQQVNEALVKGAAAAAPVVGARPAAISPLSPSSTQIGLGRPGLTSVPAGPPAPLQSSGGDDDYGEITIEESGPQRDGTGQPSPGGYAGRTSAAETTPQPVAPMLGPAPGSAPGPTLTPMVTPSLSHRSATPSPSSTVPSAGFGAAGPALRPSLIPGMRPGAAPTPARPGAAPGRPIVAPGFTAPAGPATQLPIPTPNQTPAIRAPYPQAPPQVGAPGPARTLVGLPTTVSQPQGRFGAPAAPARPPTQPVRPLDSRTPAPLMTRPMPQSSPPAAAVAAPVPAPAAFQTPAPLFPASSAAASAVASKIDHKIDQKIAAISARGPEYEAIAKLSREIIEKVVWEVVPELAEVIIREELQKRGRL